jgi:hypothetical protein
MEDLLTAMLDWPMTSLKYQGGRSDITLTQQEIRYLIVKTKRPGALLGQPSAVEKAVNQARRYPEEQKVRRIAVSDGTLVAAWDLGHSEDYNKPRLRLPARLDTQKPALDLWWVSVQGIYRPMTDPVETIEPCEAEPRPDTDDRARRHWRPEHLANHRRHPLTRQKLPMPHAHRHRGQPHTGSGEKPTDARPLPTPKRATRHLPPLTPDLRRP